MKDLPKHDLDTPALVVDLDLLQANITKMQEFLTRQGKGVRPHAKTHKCSRISALQIEAGAVGVCAAKVGEAEALVSSGIPRVLITGPVGSRTKQDRVAELAAQAEELLVVVDHPQAAQGLHRAAARRGTEVGVLIGVDPGLGRTGVHPDGAEKLADHIAGLDHLRLEGIQAYAGQVQHICGHEQRRGASLQTMGQAQEVFRALKRAGHEVRIFSGGGTGSFDIDCEVEDLTDLQAGSYVVMDTQYQAIGSQSDDSVFDEFQPALTILTSVVSANHDGYVTVDAGLKCLYRDTPPPKVVTAPRGIRAEQCSYDWFGDEYGRLSVPKGAPRPALGSVFEMVVSHCDPTINLFDRLLMVREGLVVDTWEVDLRGRST